MGVPWRGDPAWSLVDMAEEEVRRDLSRMLLDPGAAPAGVFQTHMAVVLCSMMAWSSLRSVLRPAALAGHSLGLVSALHAAGVLSARDAVRVVALRAVITGRASRARPGGMAAVLAGAGIAKAACAGADCWVANDNGPEQTVISGSPADLAAAMAAAGRLGARDVIPLQIDGAFHSPLMRDAVAEFADALADVSFGSLEAPLVYNGRLYLPDEPVPWAQVVADDLVSSVRWRETQLRLAELGVNALVEVGFGRTLTGIAKRALPGVLLHNVGSPRAAAEAPVLCLPAAGGAGTGRRSGQGADR
jgi:[acyl-carrier-protein] S-malonyltransferase